MATPRLRLHAIVDGLINLSGASTQEAAIRAGIAPGTVAALRDQEPTQVVTWCRMVAALGCGLSIECNGRWWAAEMAPPAPPLTARSWKAWRYRRLVSATHSIADLQERLSRAERENRAKSYVEHEEARLRLRLAGLRPAMKRLNGHYKIASLRQAVKMIAQELAITAEELSLLAGVHLAAAQNAFGEDNDGRLVTLHRLLSALQARMRLDLGGDGVVDIQPCEPGPWVPGQREEEPTRPRLGPADTGRIANRSRLEPARILSLYDEGVSIGEIARKAGISRQRVHKMAMDAGRTARRQLAKEARIAAGAELLSAARR